MCDPADLGGMIDSSNLGRPALFVFDRYPGGLGFAEQGYARLDELARARARAPRGLPVRRRAARRASGCRSCAPRSSRTRTWATAARSRQGGGARAAGRLAGLGRRCCGRRVVSASLLAAGTLREPAGRAGSPPPARRGRGAAPGRSASAREKRPAAGGGRRRGVPARRRVARRARRGLRARAAALARSRRRGATGGGSAMPPTSEADLAALCARSGSSARCSSISRPAGSPSSPVFLAGTMHWNGEDFVLRQYFARHYGEEARAARARWAGRRADFEFLVTFNGKSYDVPFLRGRAVVHGVPLALPPRHLDLLHPARRRWRDELPDCRLQTLELRVCRRRRVGRRAGRRGAGPLPRLRPPRRPLSAGPGVPPQPARRDHDGRDPARAVRAARACPSPGSRFGGRSGPIRSSRTFDAPARARAGR